MRKATKALSGASQDAYFRRVLKACAAVPAEERERIVGRLRREVSQLRVRRVPADVAAAEIAEMLAPPALQAEPARPFAPAAAPPPAAAFDPFSPNVVVVLRTQGREQALGALAAIEGLDDLRLLAREQRLSIPPELACAADIRAAIVGAAERRVANRLAAVR